MQYHNKREASACRAILQGSFALLGILTVMAFFGDFGIFCSLRFVMLGLFVFAVVAASIGGLNELDLSTDERYVEVRCAPVLSSRGRLKTYSVDSDKLLGFKHRSFLFFHYLTFWYIRHNGQERRVSIGLTLMDSRKRKAFLSAMEHAAHPHSH